MTRKDFALIAATLLAERPEEKIAGEFVRYTFLPPWHRGAVDEWSTTVLAFSGRLAGTNTRFDAARFLDAAGYPHPSLR